MKELILGGTRSGKSRLAELSARNSALDVVYIATARAGDDMELLQRIDLHRQRRPANWQVVEEPYGLASTMHRCAAVHRCLLIECLTMWLTNLLCANDGSLFERERDALLAVLPALPGHIILVGNETGLGVVPLGELTRRFTDEAGQVHQELARICDRVIFSIAGLPHLLKGIRQ
jgi:adenosylcobinamide kinase/adenosylcobinamide-phosphate guanylyltransferase